MIPSCGKGPPTILKKFNPEYFTSNGNPGSKNEADTKGKAIRTPHIEGKAIQRFTPSADTKPRHFC